MTDAGFFKGTSTDQDSRFADKKKKLMKSMKFGVNLNQKIDILKVNVETIKPWIIKRITELLTYEDDIVYEYALNMLSEQFPDPKDIQINLTAFLGSKNARIFVTELWDLLLSAMTTPGGAPAILLEAKKAELLETKKSEEKMRAELSRAVAASSVPLESKPAPIPARDNRRERRRYTSSPDNDRSQRDNPPVTSRFRDVRRHERRRSRSRHSRSSSRRYRKDRHDRRTYDDDSYFDNHRRRDRRERRRSPDVNEEDGPETRNSLVGPICVPQEFGAISPARLQEDTTTSPVARDLPVERKDTSTTADTSNNVASSTTPTREMPDTSEEPEIKRRRKDDRELDGPTGRPHRDKDEYTEESFRRSGARSPQDEVRRRGEVRKSDELRYRDRPHNYADERRYSRQRQSDQSPLERDYPRNPYRSSYRPQDDDHRRVPAEGRRRDEGVERGRHADPSKRDSNYAGFWEEERSTLRRSRDFQRERRYSPEGPSAPPVQRKARSPDEPDLLHSPEGPALPNDAPAPPEVSRLTPVNTKASPLTKDKHHSSSSSSSDTSGSSTESDTDSSASSSSSGSSSSSRSSSSTSSSDNEDVPRKKVDVKSASQPADRHKSRVKKVKSRPESSRRRRPPVDEGGSTKTPAAEKSLEKKDKPQKVVRRRIIKTREPSLSPEGPPLPDVANLTPTEWQESKQSKSTAVASSSSSSASSDSSATESSSEDDASSTSASASSSVSSNSRDEKKSAKERLKGQSSNIIKNLSSRGDETKKHPRVGDKEEKNGGSRSAAVTEKAVESPSVQGDGDEDRLRRQALESLKRRRGGSDV